MSREKIVEIIKEILKSSGVKKAYLFGSFARNEKKYHDIDIAIKPPKDFSLLDLAHLENVIEDKTKKKIDLGTIDSINPIVKKYVKKDLIALL
ncbi:MAG: nucleotidyltransferase domain-containing protein [Nitrospirae bacterium]|nr:nucleotidyltransferase domain-containing protein [Nitrospirota bacterium]